MKQCILTQKMIFLKNRIGRFGSSLIATLWQPMVIDPLYELEDIPILPLHFKCCIDSAKNTKNREIGVFEFFAILWYHAGDIMTLLQRCEGACEMIVGRRFALLSVLWGVLGGLRSHICDVVIGYHITGRHRG